MGNTDISAEERAEHFLREETQFHLGFLQTEQPHPGTSGLDKVSRKDISAGIRMLLGVDRDIPPKAAKVVDSPGFERLVSCMEKALSSGGRVVFSGCGATGRLSILLESAWRKCCRDMSGRYRSLKGLSDRVFSIMTGGDYALIRSVESFEDYMSFGRRQVRDLNIGPADTFVAITEGGETSSVLGSAMQAADDGARVFLAFNNPTDILREKIERSRKTIEDPRITVLDLSTGPMALAGSTRMQAVTSELLVLGHALEKTISAILRRCGAEPGTVESPSGTFEELLDSLAERQAVATLSSLIEFEESIYRNGGLVTYFADALLLDIFTDTTERSPTFALPPFVRSDDSISPQPWAFVKNPLYPTPRAWEKILGRMPRCLEWEKKDYMSMDASEKIVTNPPSIGYDDIMKFRIGRERDNRRFGVKPSAAIAIMSVSDMASGAEKFLDAFDLHRKYFSESRIFVIGKAPEIPGVLSMPCSIGRSPVDLWEHLAVKLVMNTVSTITMARMGRIESNWMAWVETSNKKLIDRATRLISELCNLSYEDACRELFISISEIEKADWKGREKPSPVQHAIRRMNYPGPTD